MDRGGCHEFKTFLDICLLCSDNLLCGIDVLTDAEECEIKSAINLITIYHFLY